MAGTNNVNFLHKFLFYFVNVVLPIWGLLDILGSAGSDCEELRGSGLFVIGVLNVLV